MKADEKKIFIEKQRQMFEKGCKYLLENVGEKPFHLKGRLNYAVMDSIMSCVFTAMSQDIKDFKERYMLVLRDSSYLESVMFNTSDEKTVKNRFELARKYLLNQ